MNVGTSSPQAQILFTPSIPRNWRKIRRVAEPEVAIDRRRFALEVGGMGEAAAKFAAENERV